MRKIAKISIVSVLVLSMMLSGAAAANAAGPVETKTVFQVLNSVTGWRILRLDYSIEASTQSMIRV